MLNCRSIGLSRQHPAVQPLRLSERLKSLDAYYSTAQTVWTIRQVMQFNAYPLKLSEQLLITSTHEQQKQELQARIAEVPCLPPFLTEPTLLLLPFTVRSFPPQITLWCSCRTSHILKDSWLNVHSVPPKQLRTQKSLFDRSDAGRLGHASCVYIPNCDTRLLLVECKRSLSKEIADIINVHLSRGPWHHPKIE
jgi:hypothetical protein